MELLPREIKRQVPALSSQSGMDDPMVYAKFFTSAGAFAWFITEFNHEDNDTCFGYIFDHDEGEFGYFSLQSLQGQGPLMSLQTLNSTENTIDRTSVDGTLPTVTRDLPFIPKRLSAAKAEYLKLLEVDT